ncbi:MAG: hypothetical protein HQ508_01195, partial [Candidatus Marinimicrobia bacterium]|nr:hypothetical protein [Candidatus Neomarinimicrobiota bacterium]
MKLRNVIIATLLILVVRPTILNAASPSKSDNVRQARLTKNTSLGADDNNHAGRRIGIHSGNKIYTRNTNNAGIAD